MSINDLAPDQPPHQGRHVAEQTPIEPALVATPEPGWYATAEGTHERWHDGTEWSDHVRPNGSSI